MFGRAAAFGNPPQPKKPSPLLAWWNQMVQAADKDSTLKRGGQENTDKPNNRKNKKNRDKR